MKKIILLLLVFTMLPLGGCGAKDKEILNDIQQEIGVLKEEQIVSIELDGLSNEKKRDGDFVL